MIDILQTVETLSGVAVDALEGDKLEESLRGDHDSKEKICAWLPHSFAKSSR
jgi:hypothetical protein